MKPIFVYDEGINLWEQSKKAGDSSVATITVIQRDIDSLSKTWFSFLPILLTFLPNVFKWFTTGNAFVGSKVQELKLKKQLTEGFSDQDLLKKNESTGIYSSIKNETGNIKSLSLDSLSQYRYSSLIFCSKILSQQSLLDSFQKTESGIKLENVGSIFDNDLGIVLCRAYDDGETHAAMQFIGKVNQIENIKSELSASGFEEIDETEVAAIINS
ncbi:hypothetical protein [Pseudoalteromonas luteoviolacea]|uniref:Uncharacterized protein n=1 Tax=Pseudoalteromonas luteoviolacea NCIMB 1942 TaxID=1365253 RepID=A0A167HC28_9GAMM|nr:hypothetical protein [Pseudoalteromonas luteoviolacea]KZN57958.1 hypothetical protein N482_22925 [Pseudoalteromonas luteoviolacea NCIMB 1942]